MKQTKTTNKAKAKNKKQLLDTPKFHFKLADHDLIYFGLF